MKRIPFCCIFIFYVSISILWGGPNKKYELWTTPGYFRGFNIGYWSNHGDRPRKIEDLKAIRALGANLLKLNLYEGFRRNTPPYDEITDNMRDLKLLIEMCRKTGLYYVIDVRGGPGRRDVSDEVFRDSIWKDKAVRKKYAEMLQKIVRLYGKDPLFAGLNIMIEPNPLWEYIEKEKIETPEELEKEMERQKIDLHGLFAYFIKEIRLVDKMLPCIVQCVSYSSPEWWGLMKKQPDPYVVYDVHSYVPYEFTHARFSNSREYPGEYWNMALNRDVVYDKKILKTVILDPVRKFQQKYRVPVILGEFGLRRPQNGGIKFLSDYVDIAVEYGWHFALWEFRPNDPDTKKHIEFDPEKWAEGYWKEVLSWFG